MNRHKASKTGVLGWLGAGVALSFLFGMVTGGGFLAGAFVVAVLGVLVGTIRLSSYRGG